MADNTAADVLGTPDSTAIPPNLAAPAPTGDATGIPATVAAPAAGTDMPTPMGSTPGTEVPPDPEVAAGAAHQNWLAHILDTVGTILGGDKTIVATKHPDGSVSVEHNPSTTGEKWGRIAQAALGGAARGMAAGQGPGGAGKAFAAGAQAGLQQPQQSLAAANEEAKNMNAQQLAIANMALTHQNYLANAEQMRESGIKFTQDQADRYNAILKSTRDAPGSEDLGNFVGVTDLPSLKAKYPDAYNAHIGQNDKVLQFDPQIDPKTLQQTGSHITLLSKPLAERMMPPGTPPLTQSYYDSATKTIKSRDIDPSNMNRLEYSTAQQNLTTQNSKLALDLDKEQNKLPTNLEELATAAQTETNPVKKQQLLDAYAQREKDKIREEQAGRAAAAPLYTPPAGGGQATTTPSGAPVVGQQWGAGDPNSAFERVSRMLQTGNMALSQVKAIRGKGNPTQQDYIGRADQIDREAGGPGLSPATQEARYKARVQTTEAYTGNGPAATKINGFSTLLEHLGDMSDNADELRNTNSPFLNKPINELDRSIAGGTRVGPAELRTSAPAHEFANVLSNNRALNNDEKAEASKSLNVNMTPAQLQQNGKQMARTAIERLAPVMQGYREATNGAESPTQLTPRAIRTLQSMGLYDYAMQELHGTPAPTNAPATNTAPPISLVPPGHDTMFANGQVWRNVNGAAQRIK